MQSKYYNILFSIEKLYKLFLEHIRTKLISIDICDINNVQWLILYNIGDKSLNVGEITKKGYYMGSNVSYNLRKLIENGYIIQQPCNYDRRQSEVSITGKGKEIRKKLDELLSIDIPYLFSTNSIEEKNLEDLQSKLLTIENFLKKNVGA